MTGGGQTRPCETCGGDHRTRDHDDAAAVERRYESADLPPGSCPWCRECGSCDYGLPMSCTCGDCDCTEDCGHPNCEAAEWADRDKRAIPTTFEGTEHDETCCMNGVAPSAGPHPDCPGKPGGAS